MPKVMLLGANMGKLASLHCVDRAMAVHTLCKVVCTTRPLLAPAVGERLGEVHVAMPHEREDERLVAAKKE